MTILGNMIEDRINAVLQNADDDPSEPVFIGKLDEFSKDELEKVSALVFIHYDDVFYTHCPLPLHSVTGTILSNYIYDAIKASVKETSTKIIYDGPQDVSIVNELGCHPKYNKQPDGAIWVRPTLLGRRVDPLVVIETAITHETMVELMIEGNFYLNEYTDIPYCVLFIVDPSNTRFSARIIVLESRRSNKSGLGSPENKKSLLNSVKREHCNEKSEYVRLKREKKKFYQWSRAEIAMFTNGSVVFDLTIDESDFVDGNYPEDILFTLNTSLLFLGTLIEHGGGQVDVRIPAEEINLIRTLFYQDLRSQEE